MTDCSHKGCDRPAVIHTQQEHTGACETAEVILDRLSSPQAWGVATGVPDAQLAYEKAFLESQNPALQRMDWTKTLSDLRDKLTAAQQQATKMHVEHRARLLADMRKGHTHAQYACDTEAHLKAIGAEPEAVKAMLASRDTE